jgi:cell wall-associated NlpC family hydrolase
VSYLLTMALLTGGTVNSSEAAERRLRPARKNHSTTVKKQQKSKSSREAANASRYASVKAHVAVSETARGRRAEAKAPGAPRKAAARQIETAARVVEAPRTTLGSLTNTRLSSPQTQPSAAEREAAIRQVLARRTWIEPRRSTEPAQVQDPPVLSSVAPRDPAQLSAAADDLGREPEVVLVAQADAGDPATNEDLIREALRNRGAPYVWGGASRGGFDCSGFVCYVFRKQRGMNLPHSASAQARLGTPVQREELQPGDLVFFSTYRRGISHVGIYLGDNRFVHAANRRSNVRIDTLTGYYGNRLRSARRLSPAPLRFSPKELEGLAQDASVPPSEE